MKKIDLMHIKYDNVFGLPFMKQAYDGYMELNKKEYSLYELYVDRWMGYILILGYIKDSYLVYSYNPLNKRNGRDGMILSQFKYQLKNMKLVRYEDKDRDYVMDYIIGHLAKMYCD